MNALGALLVQSERMDTALVIVGLVAAAYCFWRIVCFIVDATLALASASVWFLVAVFVVVLLLGSV
jgi:hypothetical protein